jgi:hypothetical protein
MPLRPYLLFIACIACSLCLLQEAQAADNNLLVPPSHMRVIGSI